MGVALHSAFTDDVVSNSREIPPCFLEDKHYFQASTEDTEGTKHNWAFEVFLDGVHQRHCVRAHRRMGWVTYHVTDKDGELVLDGLGRRKVITLRGKVEFRLV